MLVWNSKLITLFWNLSRWELQLSNLTRSNFDCWASSGQVNYVTLSWFKPGKPNWQATGVRDHATGDRRHEPGGRCQATCAMCHATGFIGLSGRSESPISFPYLFVTISVLSRAGRLPLAGRSYTFWLVERLPAWALADGSYPVAAASYIYMSHISPSYSM